MNDYIVRATAANAQIRAFAATTRNLVETARMTHNTSPVVSAALGRLLTGGVMMGSMLKGEDDLLTLQVSGDGPLKGMTVTADARGDVKGYAIEPQVMLPPNLVGKLDVGGAIGQGSLRVIKDMGLKEPYSSTIELKTGEIADDLTAYFYISEQQNTSVALGVKVETDYSIGAAGGMIIQMLPDAEEGAIDALEKMITQMPPLTTLIDRVKEKGAGLSENGLVSSLLDEIFSGLPADVRYTYAPEILDEREISWECDCSRERIEQALMTIGRKDLQEIIEEDGKAELQCQFCLKKYNFDKGELEEILENI